MVLDNSVGIDSGFMTTIHSFTGDQNTVDQAHSDLRRARAGALSMIPTSTGATKAIEEIFPDLKGNLSAISVRVPTPNVSMVDFVARIKTKATIKEINEVNNDEMILDIGPKTIASIKDIINKSNTVLWNGPAGYFENPNFANGTKEILKIINNKKSKGEIYSVAGGGETVAVINKFNKLDSFNFVSTAGGAFLEYLEGKELPGIKALN